MCGLCGSRRRRRRNSFVIVCDCKRFDFVPMRVHNQREEEFEEEDSCCSRIVDELDDINDSIRRLGRRDRRRHRHGCGFCNLFRGCRDRDDFRFRDRDDFRFRDRDCCC